MQAMVDKQRRLQQAKQSLDDMEEQKVTQVFSWMSITSWAREWRTIRLG